MPRLLDSDCTFDVVLESDKGKTDPPTFVFRALSARDFIEQVERFEDNSGSDADNLRRVFGVITSALVGWNNMGPHSYDAEKIDAILSMTEAVELGGALLAGQNPSGDDLKN